MRHLLPMNEFESAICYFAARDRGGGPLGLAPAAEAPIASATISALTPTGSCVFRVMVAMTSFLGRCDRCPVESLGTARVRSRHLLSLSAERPDAGPLPNQCSNKLCPWRRLSTSSARACCGIAALDRVEDAAMIDDGRLQVGVRRVGDVEDDPERLREALPDAHAGGGGRRARTAPRGSACPHRRSRSMRPVAAADFIVSDACRQSSGASSASNRSTASSRAAPRASGAGRELPDVRWGSALRTCRAVVTRRGPRWRAPGAPSSDRSAADVEAAPTARSRRDASRTRARR